MIETKTVAGKLKYNDLIGVGKIVTSGELHKATTFVQRIVATWSSSMYAKIRFKKMLYKMAAIMIPNFQ